MSPCSVAPILSGVESFARRHTPGHDHLPQPDKEALLAASRVLESEGPTLGRPLVDTVVGSRHANMKELRPGSTGRTEIRVPTHGLAMAAYFHAMIEDSDEDGEVVPALARAAATRSRRAAR